MPWSKPRKTPISHLGSSGSCILTKGPDWGCPSSGSPGAPSTGLPAAKESALGRRQGRQTQGQALLDLIHHLLDALLVITGKYLLLIITPGHFHNSEETYSRRWGRLQVNRVTKEHMDRIYRTYTYIPSDLQQSSPREKTARNKKSKTQGSCKKVICLDF